MAVNAYTSGQTLTTDVCGETVVNTSGGNTHVLPAVATLTGAFAACYIEFKTVSGAVTIDTPGAETIIGPAGSAATLAINPAIGSGSVRLQFDGTNWQALNNVVTATSSVLGVLNTATSAQVRTGNSTLIVTPTGLGTALMNKGTDIPAAGTLTIPADGNYFDVTGTTSITGLSSIANAVTGWEMTLKFEGATKLVHSTALILPGQKDMFVFDGDSIKARYEGSGNWRVVSVARASGAPADPAPIRSVFSKQMAGQEIDTYGGGANDGSSGTLVVAASQTHPGGVMTIGTGTDVAGFQGKTMSGLLRDVVGTNPIVYEVGFSVNTLADGTNDYEVFIGLGDTFDIRAAVDQIGLYYDRDTSANWIMRTNNDGTSTNTASSVAVATGDKRLTVVINAAGTSVEYFLDGVSLGTVSTNIPTGTGDAMEVGAAIDKEAGTTARTMNVNFMSFTQYLATPR